MCVISPTTFHHPLPPSLTPGPFQFCWCAQAGYLQPTEQHSPFALIPRRPSSALLLTLHLWRAGCHTYERHATSWCKRTSMSFKQNEYASANVCTTEMGISKVCMQTQQIKQQRCLDFCFYHRIHWRAVSVVIIKTLCHNWALHEPAKSRLTPSSRLLILFMDMALCSALWGVLLCSSPPLLTAEYQITAPYWSDWPANEMCEQKPQRQIWFHLCPHRSVYSFFTFIMHRRDSDADLTKTRPTSLSLSVWTVFKEENAAGTQNTAIWPHPLFGDTKTWCSIVYSVPLYLPQNAEGMRGSRVTRPRTSTVLCGTIYAIILKRFACTWSTHFDVISKDWSIF